MKYYANTSIGEDGSRSLGQELAWHTAGVMAASIEELSSAFNETNDQKRPSLHIVKSLLLAALFHDNGGKADETFQKFLTAVVQNQTPDSFKGPYHNEVSWALLEVYFAWVFANECALGALNKTTLSHLTAESPSDSGKIENDYNWRSHTFRSAVSWHHEANFDSKNGKLRFGTASEVLSAAAKNAGYKSNVKKYVQIALPRMIDLSIESCAIFMALCHDKPDEVKFISEVSEILSRSRLAFSPKTIDDALIHVSQRCVPAYRTKLMDGQRNVPNKRFAEFLLVTELMRSADRKSSALQKFSMAEYKEKHRPKSIVSKFSLNNCIPSERTQSQIGAAKKAILSQQTRTCSVIAAGPGQGKTDVLLNWWALNLAAGSNKKLILAMPGVKTAESMHSRLLLTGASSPLGRIFQDSSFRVGLFFGGKDQLTQRKIAHKDCDISVIGIDRILSPTYKAQQKVELLDILTSHLVIDEYHELVLNPAMYNTVLILAEMFKLLNNKMLLLSGTPSLEMEADMGSLTEQTTKLSDLMPANRKKLNVQASKLSAVDYLKQPGIQAGIAKKGYAVMAGSRTEAFECYRNAIDFDESSTDLFISSGLRDDEKNKRIEQVERDFSECLKATLANYNVYFPKILDSSYDLSFNGAIASVKNVYSFMQLLGRILRFKFENGTADVILCCGSKTKDAGVEIIKDYLLENYAQAREVDYLQFIEEIYEVIGRSSQIIRGQTHRNAKKSEKENDFDTWFPKKQTSEQLEDRVRIHYKHGFRSSSYAVLIPVVKNGEHNGYISGKETVSNFEGIDFERSLRIYANAELRAKYKAADQNPSVITEVSNRLNALLSGITASRHKKSVLTQNIGIWSDTPILLSQDDPKFVYHYYKGREIGSIPRKKT
jgi:hypothetical protein